MKNIFIITCLKIIILAGHMSGQGSRQGDSLALVAIYNSTNGSGWYNNTNWLTNNPINTWYGVTLKADGRVVTLNLSYNGLSGTIPNDIENLTTINDISLDNNQITGPIPNEIGNLAALTNLILWNNQLTGSIPNSIGNCIKLSTLSLSVNKLSGSIPNQLGNCNNLNYLFLRNNQLTGTIPKELGNCVSLIELTLSTNQLTGSIPKEIGNLINLQRLYLSSNQLTGTFSTEITGLVLLTDLSLTRNQLTGEIPKSIKNLSELKLLGLGGNKFSGTIPLEIGQLIKLTGLYLWGNSFSGSIPKEIGNLSNLENLELSENQLAGSIPIEFGKLSALQTLYLERNQLTGAIPKEICNITNLQKLFLGNNQLVGTIPEEIGNLILLRELYLGYTNLNGTIPISIGNLTNMQYFHLYETNISGSIPSEIGNCKSLRYLALGHTKLNGLIPKQIGNLDSLGLEIPNFTQGGLFLDSCNFTPQPLPPLFTRLRNLQRFWINNSNITGLPDIASPLPILKEFKIQNNKLTFDDIEKNYDIASRDTLFNYSPQDSLGVTTDTTINQNREFRIRTLAGETTNNLYKWFKNGVVIPSATSKEFVITSLKKSDEGVYSYQVTNSVVANLILYSRLITLKVQDGTPVEEDEYSNGITFEPNPVNNVVTFRFPEKIQFPISLNIYDALGNQMTYLHLSGNSHSYQFDVHNLASGIYVARATVNGTVFSMRFVVNK